MVSVKRNKVEMYLDTIRAVQLETAPTRLMTRANLSWYPMFNEIIPHLLTHGLIAVSDANDKNDNKRKYSYYITEKGFKLITMQNEMYVMLGFDLPKV